MMICEQDQWIKYLCVKYLYTSIKQDKIDMQNLRKESLMFSRFMLKSQPMTCNHPAGRGQNFNPNCASTVNVKFYIT